MDFPDEIIEKFRDVAEFITCFYCIWLLQSHEAARTRDPFADILSLQQMFKYQKESKHPEAVHKAIESINKHSWYLDPTLMPLALSDYDVPKEEK